MRTGSLVVLALVACAHAQPSPPAAQETPKPAPAPAATPPPAAPAPTPAARSTAVMLAPVSVYFDFDRSDLKPDARQALENLYGELRGRPDLHVRIEGNCDERGTTEYNVALGQRRAEAAKKYLERLGLEPSRITAVSNGKEKPRAAGHDEDAWRENRRDDVIPSNNAVGWLQR
jgi:peptidoglycan-associated lipoprotein